jgi:uncharacterized protein (TIGR02421 family)
MNLDKRAAIDATIVDAARDIKALSRLSWPAETMTAFLSDWQRGKPRLPSIEYPATDDLVAPARALGQAAKALESFDDPIADYLAQTALSYLSLCELLTGAGTHSMLDHSRVLYGLPGDCLSEGEVSNLEAARHFLDQSAQYYQATHLREADYCVSAEVVKADLEARLAEVFPKETVRVAIDPQLTSKAAAGSTRIRLRGDTCFSSYDLEQLLQHEAFVHSLTALNGRAQPHLKCLGLGAPRTTGAQEGLATFSELITGAIDIDRMERIALRVIGIDMALGGADFIEVFRYFLEAGQPEKESFNSAMRVFRGAPVSGGSAFTKDVVYVHGLMEVHTFFRWALSKQRMELCRYFFAGRMTITDAVNLAPFFESGQLAAPKFLPPWMTRTNGLVGYLAFSIFANRISIDALNEHHRFERIQDISA